MCYIICPIVTPPALSPTSKSVLLHVRECDTYMFLCLCTQDCLAYSNLILNRINKPSTLSLHHLFHMAFLEVRKFSIPSEGSVNGLTSHTSYLTVYTLLSS